MKLTLIRIMIVLFLIGESLLLLLWGSLVISIQLIFVGLPAFLVTLWLFVLHIQGFRQLNKKHHIEKKIIRRQKIAGTLLISFCTAILMYVVWLFNEFGSDGSAPSTKILIDSIGYVTILFIIPVALITYAYFWIAKTLALENVEKPGAFIPPPQLDGPVHPPSNAPPPLV